MRIYEALTARYPFTAAVAAGAPRHHLRLLRAGEKESAKDAAETFIRENPTHPRIDYAWYLKGLIDFERMPNVLERWLGVDMTERPPQGARDAFAAFAHGGAALSRPAATRTTRAGA